MPVTRDQIIAAIRALGVRSGDLLIARGPDGTVRGVAYNNQVAQVRCCTVVHLPAIEDASIADIWHRSRLFVNVRQQTMAGMSECGACEVRGHPLGNRVMLVEGYARVSHRFATW